MLAERCSRHPRIEQVAAEHERAGLVSNKDGARKRNVNRQRTGQLNIAWVIRPGHEGVSNF